MKTPSLARKGGCGALAASLSIAMGCATAKQASDTSENRHEVVPLIGTVQVHRFRFPNGLKLLVVEDHSSPTFAYQTWFNVGSRNEVDGKTGLAHLFEHMMFKQTKGLKEGEFDRILEGAGAEGENAFTSRNYTTYVQELPSRAEAGAEDNLELIARLEAERMVNLVVDDKAFRTETEVVQNERRLRTENSPDGTLSQELFALAFKSHPYRWPVIGFQKDLEAMKADDALAFYRAYYSPARATIVVVGDVDPERVQDAISKHYEKIPAQPTSAARVPVEPEQKSARRKVLKLNITVEKLAAGYHIPDATHEDLPVLAVVRSVLAGGNASRLKRALVDTGIATEVGASEYEETDPSLFFFKVDLQKGKKAAHAERVILKEIDRLVREGLDDKEVERARNTLLYQFYSSLEDNSAKAGFLGTYETLAGTFEQGLKFIKRASTATPAEVVAAARRYLRPENRTVITGVPK